MNGHAQTVGASVYDWSGDNSTAVLKKDGREQAVLHFNRYDIRLVWKNREMKVASKGFWLPRLVIEEGGVTIAALENRFFGSNNIITFQSGNKYSSEFKNTPLATLIIKDSLGNELIRYKLSGKSGQAVQMELSVNSLLVAEEDLIILLVIGFMATRNITQENISCSAEGTLAVTTTIV